MIAPTEIERLRSTAKAIRRNVLEMCRERGQGYAGQGLALAELMSVLYFDAIRRRDGEFHERLVLSTGHSAIAVFAALGLLDLYDIDELRTYGSDGSRIDESPLQGIPGFDITAGVMGVEPVDAKFEAFGFRARRVAGNDLPGLLDAFSWARQESDRPAALVVETVLGHGVRAFESLRNVHYVRADTEFWNRALEELA